MLNLLFISDSPKVELIKHELQPVLKVIIDVVIDFDHGLKDVFEKRPTTVCIQDHIGGVTGESVARHIQMLLGNSAPKFILLHTGSGKSRTINGLYEHLVDLSQPVDTLTDTIKNTLKSLLGDQWEKIYVPPKQTPASIRKSLAVPEESREHADKLVDDFLSDLETSGFTVASDQPLPSDLSDRGVAEVTATLLPVVQEPEAPSIEDMPVAVQSTNDEMAELLLAEVEKANREQSPADTSSAVFSQLPEMVASADQNSQVIADSSFSPAIKPATKKESASLPQSKLLSASENELTPVPIAPSSVSPAADFRISQNGHHVEEHIPEELLLAFEENYRSESNFMKRGVAVVLVCVVCAAGGWYFVKQNPQVLNSLKRYSVFSSSAPKTPVVPAVPAPVQNSVPAPAPPITVVPLPTFIPKDGLDSAYSSQKPGWERYVGKDKEFRVFKDAGRVKAIQVMAVGTKSAHLDSFVGSVLKEVFGTSEYIITSRALKAGVRIENGSVAHKGEILIYRKNGAVRAFVVSIN